MAQLLDGRLVASKKAEKLKETVKLLKSENIFPKFCIINIGDDPASKIYLKSKKKLADQLGIEQVNYQFSKHENQEKVLDLIQKLNLDNSVYGIMVQLPVPDNYDAIKLLNAIDPNKDVDAISKANIGALWIGKHFVEPATAIGIIELLNYYQIGMSGKNFVIIGRSNIVGKPLAALALENNATVSILHSSTKDLSKYTNQADIVVCAAGQPNILTADMVKQGAVVVDVGINRVNGKLTGDVDFDNVKKVASWITPVPGGVGPLTVEQLMEQVVKLTRRANGR